MEQRENVSPVACDRLCIRSQLVAKLTQRVGEGIAIAARAGQGKTTLAFQHVETFSGQPIHVSFSDQVKDPASLYTSLLDSLRSLDNAINVDDELSFLEKVEFGPAFFKKAAKMLGRAYESSKLKKIGVIYDDLHHIPAGDPLIAFLSDCVSQLSRTSVSFFLSRQPIPSDVVHSLNQSIQYLGNDDLAMNRHEIMQLLSAHSGKVYPLKVIEDVYEKTEGWCMGVIGESMRLKQGKSFHSRSFDSHSSYFENEILPLFDTRLQKDLMTLSLLNEIPDDLAVQLIEDKSICEKLDELCRNHQFIRLGMEKNRTYHMHHLLRDVLKRKAEATITSSNRASILVASGHWFEKQGDLEKAIISYGDGNAYVELNRMIQSNGLKLVASNKSHCLWTVLSEVPDSVRQRYPWILLMCGIIHLEKRPLESQAALRKALMLFAGTEDSVGVLAARIHLILFHIVIDSDYLSGVPHLENSVTLYRELKHGLPDYYKARFSYWLSLGLTFFQSNVSDAEVFATESVKNALVGGLGGVAVDAMVARANASILVGSFRKAFAYINEIEPILANQTVGPLAHMLLLHCKMNLLLMVGDFDNYRYCRRLMVDSVGEDQLKMTATYPFILIWDMDLCLMDGRYDDLERILVEGLKLDRVEDNAHLKSQFCQYAALYHALMNHKEKALSFADLSLAFRREAPSPYFVALNQMLLGTVFALVGDYGQAEIYLFESIRVSETIGDKYIPIGANGALCFVHEKQGQIQDQAFHARKSMQGFHKTGALHCFGLCRPVLHSVLRASVAIPEYMSLTKEFSHKKLGVSISTDGSVVSLLTIRTLGRFLIEVQGRVIPFEISLTPQQQELISMLLTSPNHTITDDEAMIVFWPDHDPEKAYRLLNVMLLRLRRSIKDIFGEEPSETYLHHKNKQISLRHCRVDVLDFEASCNAGISLYEKKNYFQSENTFRDAFTLYEGPFLSSFRKSDSAYRFEDHQLLPLALRGACLWAEMIFSNKKPCPLDLALIEKFLSISQGEEALGRILYEGYVSHGMDEAAKQIFQSYLK